MIRKIKAIYLKDSKQLFYPSDEELKRLWDYVERIDIEESYTIDEWKSKFIVVRHYDDKG